MALSANRSTRKHLKSPVEIPAAAATHIYGGSMVCLNVARYAVAGANVASYLFAGIAMEECDNSGGALGAMIVRVDTEGMHLLKGSGLVQADVGKTAWLSDDETIVVADPGTGSIKIGTIRKIESATAAWVDIETAFISGTTLAGGSITLGDVGNYFAADTAEGAAQELGATRARQKTGVVHPQSVTLEAGTALGAASGATPGLAQIANKEVVIHWPTNATPGPIAARFVLPDDLDGTAVFRVHSLMKVTGTDTPAVVHEVYINAGDTDCAGTDPEVTEGSTLTEYTCEVAAADVPDAGPAAVTVVLTPTAGELGNDSLYCYGIWLEYTRLQTAP